MNVPRKRVQVLNERDENFPQPRRLRVLEGLRHRFGDVFLPLNNHGHFRSLCCRLVEELIYLSSGLRINSWYLGKIGQACPLDCFHSAKMTEQGALSRGSDPRNFLKSGLADILFATCAVGANSEAVGFVPQSLNKIK